MMKRFALAAATLLLAALPLMIPPPPVHANGNQKRFGAALFHERGCEHCHGADGIGGELGPELSTIGKQMTKPELEHRILKGGGGMPPFADALQPDEVAALVEYLHAKKKALKHKPIPPPATAPPPA